ncbi:MAG: hypothetical protein ACUVQG_11725 [Thermogutta sp.]
MSRSAAVRRILVVAMITAVLTGCKVTLSTKPVGLEPVKLNPEEWNGIWRDPVNNGFVAVRVADADQGVLEVAGIETREDALEMKKLRVHIRQANNWMFLSWQAEDRPGQYFWWRIKRSESNAVLWTPHWDRISKLVRDGILPGKHISENVLVLDELDAKGYEVLTSEENVLMDWENPIILLRTKTQ